MTTPALADLVDACGEDWAAMSPRDSSSRHCSACSRLVVDVGDLSALISASKLGLCVAVDDTIPLNRDDILDRWPIHKLGVVYSKSKPGVRGVSYKKPKRPLGAVVNDCS